MGLKWGYSWSEAKNFAYEGYSMTFNLMYTNDDNIGDQVCVERSEHTGSQILP